MRATYGRRFETSNGPWPSSERQWSASSAEWTWLSDDDGGVDDARTRTAEPGRARSRARCGIGGRASRGAGAASADDGDDPAGGPGARDDWALHGSLGNRRRRTGPGTRRGRRHGGIRLLRDGARAPNTRRHAALPATQPLETRPGKRRFEIRRERRLRLHELSAHRVREGQPRGVEELP